MFATRLVATVRTVPSSQQHWGQRPLLRFRSEKSWLQHLHVCYTFPPLFFFSHVSTRHAREVYATYSVAIRI